MPLTQRTLGVPSSQWKLHAWHRCDTSADALTFQDRHAALLWLRQFQADAVTFAALRAIASAENCHAGSHWRLSDREVLELLARQMTRGVLHVHRVPPPSTAGRTADVAAPVPVRTSTPSRSRAVSASVPASLPAKAPEEADMFSSRTDAAATAAVLRNAAAQGTPFCEECARASSARRAA